VFRESATMREAPGPRGNSFKRSSFGFRELWINPENGGVGGSQGVRKGSKGAQRGSKGGVILGTPPAKTKKKEEKTTALVWTDGPDLKQ
jgi:hypothetical protein